MRYDDSSEIRLAGSAFSVSPEAPVTRQPGELIMISVDDHLIEPPGMFEGRLPAKYADRAPRLRRLPDGVDAWDFEEMLVANTGANTALGRLPEEIHLGATSYGEVRPSCYDVHARVADMSANGTLMQMCFPGFLYKDGHRLLDVEDKRLALAVLQAYNDWYVEDWAGAYPGRFIPLAILPLWDPALMAAEVRRMADRGVRAVSFAENPHRAFGLPSLYDRHWDPFWAACSDAGVVVCFHSGTSGPNVTTSPDAPFETANVLTCYTAIGTSLDLLWGGVLMRFPDLRVVFAECGIGWLPQFLERVDYAYRHQSSWTHREFGGRLPSDILRAQARYCFIDDPHGLRSAGEIGLDLILWASDQPHLDSTWPRSPEAFLESAAGVGDAVIDRATHLNAIETFGLDPFALRPAEQCTVSALRADAPDVDVSSRRYGPPVLARRVERGAVPAAGMSTALIDALS
jgi:predicted TIM-barrel fold metal-dependent hydrolase